jgi:hypothetical protein
MQVKRWAMISAIGAVLVLSGCKQDKIEEKHHPATLSESGQEGIMKVTLEARAVERLGIQTAAVREEMVGATRRLVMPYGALMYDSKGGTWTFTNPEPMVYMRAKVAVTNVEGDRVILAEGPPAGTVVVTVGAAELMGAEHKYGH